MEPKKFMSMADVGNLFGVSAATVSKWRGRYADTPHATPKPAVWIGDTPGWDNPADWRAWKEMLPGQGKGGGPLPLATAEEELNAAFKRASQRSEKVAHALRGVGKAAQDAASRLRLIALHIAAAEYGVDKDTIMAVWVKLAEENPDMPNHEVDQRALATIMRGRKKLELETAPE
jgi:transposase-like protein